MDINIPLCKNYYDFYLWYQLNAKNGTDSALTVVLIHG